MIEQYPDGHDARSRSSDLRVTQQNIRLASAFPLLQDGRECSVEIERLARLVILLDEQGSQDDVLQNTTQAFFEALAGPKDRDAA